MSFRMLPVLGWLLLTCMTLWAQQEDYPLVSEDLNVRLFAREPLVRNPCAITFDRQGNLYVGMGPQYRRPEPDTPGDSVFRLIDADHDGVADDRIEFAKGLNNIQGLAWVGDTLWVANAPDLTLITDDDGDGIGDTYTRLYADLGNIEHGLHGLNRGPDGWVYMSKGNSKGLNQAPDRVAPRAFRELWGMEAIPGTPDFPEPRSFPAEEYSKDFHHPSDDWGLNGGILRCLPDGSGLSIVSRGFRNPWDITFDSQFNWLGTDNDQNLGDKLFAPFFNANFGWGHPWSYDWKGDDHLPSAPSAGPLFEGSGTGIIYCDVAGYPEQYRGIYLVNDWLRRETYLYRPAWNGAWMRPEGEVLGSFASAGSGRTMPLSAGRSFDPVDIEIGPDGGVYISSWGREYGVTWQDGKMINEGRIYVIWPKTHQLKPSRASLQGLPLTQWSGEALIQALGEPLPALRAEAQDELVARGDKHRELLEASLEKAVPGSQQETWLLWTLGRSLVASPDANRFLMAQWGKGFNRKLQALRIAAYHTRERQLQPMPAFVGEALADQEARLRHAAILAMHQAGDRQWQSMIVSLLRGETDRLVYYSAWQSMRDLFSAAQRRALLQDEEPGVRRGAMLSLLEDDLLDEASIQKLATDPDPVTAMLAQKRISGRATPVIKGASLSSPGSGESNHEIAPIPLIRHLQAESGKPYELGVLSEGVRAYTDRSYKITELPLALDGLQFIRSANGDAEASQGGGMSFELLFPSTLYVAEDLRGTRSPAWLTQGFEKTEYELETEDARHRIFRASFPAGRVHLGSNQLDQKLSKAGYLVVIEPSFFLPQSKSLSVEAVMASLEEGDEQRGRALFHHPAAAHCAACHLLEGRGNVLAPDLADVVSRAQPRTLIESIIDPSAVITEGFASQIIETFDGEQYSGLVVSESGRDLVLADGVGEPRRLMKAEIESRKGSNVSSMPAGFGEMLSAIQVADLLAYLQAQSTSLLSQQRSEDASGLPTALELQEVEDGLVLMQGEQALARYYHAHHDVHRPFWAHVKTPQGNQVTRGFPPVEGQEATDHASMHPGLSMGFAILNGVNFWHNREGKVVHLGYEKLFPQGPVPEFVARQQYQDAEGKILCQEVVRYRFHPNSDGYLMTQESTFSSSQSFYFGVKEEMGLTMRVATPLVVKSGMGGRILSAGGGVNEQGTWGKPDKWWDYAGPIDGQWSGIQLMSGPRNPQTWAHSRDYGVLVANPFPLDIKANRHLRRDVTPDKPFTLSFGVQIHQHAQAIEFDAEASYKRYLSLAQEP